MFWTWTNGREYSLLRRFSNPGATPMRQIVSEGKVLCQGNITFAGKSRVEWNLDNDILLCEPGWRTSRLVRHADQRRFAVWYFRQCVVEGVWRPHLLDEVAPLIFGMVLDCSSAGD
jgi:hypothetical protein